MALRSSSLDSFVVVRNAVVRVKGGKVGNWEDKIDGVTVRKELVDMLRSAVGQGLRKVELTRRSKTSQVFDGNRAEVNGKRIAVGVEAQGRKKLKQSVPDH